MFPKFKRISEIRTAAFHHDEVRAKDLRPIVRGDVAAEVFPVGEKLVNLKQPSSGKQSIGKKEEVNTMNYVNAKNSTTMGRCVIYARTSEFPLMRMESLTDQERICREAAKNKGWTVLEGHIYCDQASGPRPRAGLNSLLNEAKSLHRPFDCVLVSESWWLSRNDIELEQIVNELERHNIFVFFAGRELDSRDPGFRLMLYMSKMFNEKCISALAKEVKRGQEQRVLNGFSSGGRCYGYRSAPPGTSSGQGTTKRVEAEGTRLEIIEPEAEIIRRIYEMFVNGLSMTAIANVLNLEKFTPACGVAGNGESAWNRARIGRILRNERYVGTVVWNRTNRRRHPRTGRAVSVPNSLKEVRRVATPHLRVVSDELWALVMAKLANPDRSATPLLATEAAKEDSRTTVLRSATTK